MARMPQTPPAGQSLPGNPVAPDDMTSWSKNTGTSGREQSAASEARFCPHPGERYEED